MKRKVPPENPYPFLLALLAVLGATFLAPDADSPAWLRYGIALLAGCAWLFLVLDAERRKSREADERELRIQAEGRALGFNLLVGAIVIWVPLRNAGLPDPDVRWFAVLVIATHLLGTWFTRRRYS